MSGLDIEAIRQRAARAESVLNEENPSTYRLAGALGVSAGDVPGLLAEIERLRAELLEEQTVHAKTMDNFEAMEESALEFRTHQLDRYARLELQNERLQAARAEDKEFIDRQAAELRRLCAESNDSRFGLTAERDDALQVIADLRGEAP